ncbi:SRPBCC family protein [Chitinophagaceae bacterium MMS25-I14]
MAVHRLVRTQHIPVPVDALWDFFSHPNNLDVLTPSYMNFRTTSGPLPDEIYPGQIITYKVSPVLGIPLFWMTEITHVMPGKLFVDEQRRGPYRLWHHQHHFAATIHGTLMTDIVHYQLPLSLFGTIAHRLFVKRRLEDIFDYRFKKISELFGNI